MFKVFFNIFYFSVIFKINYIQAASFHYIDNVSQINLNQWDMSSDGDVENQFALHYQI